MKKLLNILIALLIMSSCQKENINVPSEDIHTINSSYTNQKYELKVVLPKDYNMNDSYPVVYLLEGYFHFNEMRRAFNEDYLDEVILVGIFYKDYPFSLGNLGKLRELRGIDLTYPVNTNSDGTEVGGGGLKYYEFLKQEAIPLIEQNYSVDNSNRTLVGHSLGGYFCLFQMMEFRDAPIFKNIIALSPSIYWSDLELIEMEQKVKDENDDLPFNLYIGIGEQEGVTLNILVDELLV